MPSSRRHGFAVAALALAVLTRGAVVHAQQAAQGCGAHGMDDAAAMAGGENHSDPFESSEVEAKGRCGNAERGGKLTCRHARGRRDQPAQQIEPRLLGNGGEDFSGQF